MYKHKIIDFIIQFMQDANSDVSLMKLAVNSRARIVAKNFIQYVYVNIIGTRSCAIVSTVSAVFSWGIALPGIASRSSNISVFVIVLVVLTCPCLCIHIYREVATVHK